MDQIIVFILILMSVLVVAILFGIWLWRQRSIQELGVSRKTTISQVEGIGEDILPSDILAQAQDLLSERKKIEAIKLVRYHTDWNLIEAKTYIESMDAKPQVQSGLDGQSFSNLGKSVSPSVMAEVRDLLSERKIIEAIKLVNDHTGWGLKESKDFIDSLR